MAFSNNGPFTLTAATAGTVPRFRVVKVDTNGYAALPNASTDADLLVLAGITQGDETAGGDCTVRGFDGTVAKVCVAANQTVRAGYPVELTGTAGCVVEADEGMLLGVALNGGTSGASELAVISIVTRSPTQLESSGT